MSLLARSWSYRYRLRVTLACCVTAWILAIASRPLIEEGTPADHWFDLAGWVFIVAGSGLRYWATGSIAGRKQREVVSVGAYSLCRNPLYLGTLLIALAVVLFFKSLIFAVAVLPLVVMYVFAVVPAEEQQMRETLGEDYVEYCRRVSRWWPQFRNYHPAMRLNDSTRARRAEHWSLAWSLLLLPLGVEVSCYVRGHHWFGTWWPLP